MTVTRESVLAVLGGVSVPGGGTLVSQDLICALTIEGDQVRFVIEAPTTEQARSLGAAQVQAEHALLALPGVATVRVVITAHGPSGAPSRGAMPDKAPQA